MKLYICFVYLYNIQFNDPYLMIHMAFSWPLNWIYPHNGNFRSNRWLIGRKFWLLRNRRKSLTTWFRSRTTSSFEHPEEVITSNVKKVNKKKRMPGMADIEWAKYNSPSSWSSSPSSSSVSVLLLLPRFFSFFFFAAALLLPAKRREYIKLCEFSNEE